ncbi:MAG: tetratricopeptide repeat protein [Candidatus Methylomirabilia bacterium]
MKVVRRVNSVNRNMFFRAALIFLLALIAYANSFPGAFITDDIAIVRDSPLVISGSVGRIFAADYWGEGAGSGLHRPLTIDSYAVNRRFLGASAASFHAVNVLLHAGVSAAVYAALAAAGVSGGIAWAAAALFAVHPMHTEVVDIITGRAELLAALFVLLALGSALRRGRRHRLACVGWFALGLLSKESAATFPLLLSAVDLFSSGDLRAVLRERLRLYAVLALVTLGWLAYRKWGLLSGSLPPNAIYPTDNPLVLLGPVGRVLTLLKVQWLYLSRLAAPLELNAIFVDTMIGPVTNPLGLSGVSLLAGFGTLAAATVVGWRRRSVWSLGVVLYFLAFLATGNFLVLTTFLVAERFAYLPSAGFCLAVAAAAAALLAGLRTSAAARAGFALAATALVLLGSRTLVRNRDFASPLALWTAEVRSEPGNVRALVLLAGARYEEGDFVGMEAALRRGLELRPDFTETSLVLGLFLLDMDRPVEAARSFERVMGDNPARSPLAMTGMVRAFLSLGMVPEAEEWLAAIPGYFRHQPSFRSLEEQVRAASGGR